MLVKYQRWNVPYLAQIATQYLGRPVVVDLVDNAGFRGEATKRGGVDRIRLGTEQHVAQLDHAFWHELAHLQLHKFTTEASGGVNDISEATKAAAAQPNSAVLELVRLKIQKEEQEADELALKMREDFERRFQRSLVDCAKVIGPADIM